MHRRHVLLGASAAALAPAGMLMADSRSLYVPPEEAPHARTFMMWPHSLRVYGRRAFLRRAQRAIATLASTIAEFEEVILLAEAEAHAEIREYVSQDVILWDIPTEDLWARDAGPLFAFRGQEMVVSHIQFNGWGNRQVHRRDGDIAARVAERLGLALVPSGLTGEPGGIEQDGHGLLMAHESCWVHENRNPGMDRAEIEARLMAAYGADRMIWSPGLKNHDITDYHIDALARFTGPGRVLMNLPARPDAEDPFSGAALQTLSNLREAGLEVDVIPEPEKRRVRSPEFVASYVNFYVCNGGVIASSFGDRATDRQAVAALERHYPDREIVTLNMDALGELGGGIHCATQQMPA